MLGPIPVTHGGSEVRRGCTVFDRHAVLTLDAGQLAEIIVGQRGGDDPGCADPGMLTASRVLVTLPTRRVRSPSICSAKSSGEKALNADAIGGTASAPGSTT
jgi:hypothetical protein